MRSPTEPIGSIPRPRALVEALARTGGSDPGLEPLYEEAVRDTIRCFEAIAPTAFARSQDRAKALMAGYQMHVAKPIEPQELVAAIASFAGRTDFGE